MFVNKMAASTAVIEFHLNDEHLFCKRFFFSESETTFLFLLWNLSF